MSPWYSLALLSTYTLFRIRISWGSRCLLPGENLRALWGEQANQKTPRKTSIHIWTLSQQCSHDLFCRRLVENRTTITRSCRCSQTSTGFLSGSNSRTFYCIPDKQSRNIDETPKGYPISQWCVWYSFIRRLLFKHRDPVGKFLWAHPISLILTAVRTGFSKQATDRTTNQSIKTI